jgi:starch synthase (maltosyl-transferring)
MDFQNPQSGWVQFSPEACGLQATDSFTVRDLLSQVSYQWEGEWNFIALRPTDTIAHIFVLEQP